MHYIRVAVHEFPKLKKEEYPELFHTPKMRLLINHLINQSTKPEKHQENRFRDLAKWSGGDTPFKRLLDPLLKYKIVKKRKIKGDKRGARYVIDESKKKYFPLSVKISDQYVLSQYRENEIIDFSNVRLYGINSEIFVP